MDRGNDKAAVKFLLITTMMKGATTTTLLKCFEKCQQRIYKMALMPQRSRCRFVLEMTFLMTAIEAENVLEELSKCWWKCKLRWQTGHELRGRKVLIKKGIVEHMRGKLKSKWMKRKTFPKWKLNQILPLRNHRHSASSIGTGKHIRLNADTKEYKRKIGVIIWRGLMMEKTWKALEHLWIPWDKIWYKYINNQ